MRTIATKALKAVKVRIGPLGQRQIGTIYDLCMALDVHPSDVLGDVAMPPLVDTLENEPSFLDELKVILA